MGWKPGKYLGKAIKSIGRGIKKIGKGIGKAFKKVFKGIGNFIGKLGPIGMLGMMLIMPQLGAWWGQFGTWADTLVSSGKFFGNVMKGIHTAGAAVGNAYSTVTEGISNVIKSIPGVGDAYTGFENWMGDTLNKGREFLGLETTTPIVVDTPDIDISKIEFDAQTGLPKPKYETVDGISIQKDPLDIPNITKATDMSSEKFKEITDIDLGVSDTKINLGDVTGKDASKLSKLEKWGLGISTASGGINLAQQAAGLGYEDDYGYGGYVADVALPMYESAQTNWIEQGMFGTPTMGAGDPRYFQSVVSSFRNDPWYEFMMQNHYNINR